MLSDREPLSAGDGTSMPRALVLHPYLRRGAASARAPEARLAEAEGLARAINLDVVGTELAALGAVNPSLYIGKGKVEALGQRIAGEEIAIVVLDCALSPIQQRNLERAWSCKVIDRTGLILEIFGERAKTREGVLQVELAHLDYQRSRLVRSWTHLERQRGGFGFLGGPGERQIEADRRAIRDRMARLRKELEKVRKTRELHRSERRKTPFPVIALVGYTNAGKSTLFNRLTEAKVQAEDMLFATLDPTMRGIRLPSGRHAILSDTVGFISDLPTELIAAFRATLEEVLEADIIVHVRDVAHPDHEAQRADVVSVLEQLGVTESATPMIEALNKIDALDARSREVLAAESTRREGRVNLSALTGEGCPALLAMIDDIFRRAEHVYQLSLPQGEGQVIAWLHAHGEVLQEAFGEGEVVSITTRLSDAARGRFAKKYPEFELERTA